MSAYPRHIGKVSRGGRVVTADLDDLAVTTAKLGADAVTAAKIADDVVDETHLKNAFVADFTEVVVAAGDSILFGDVGDSGNTKRDTVQGILDLVPAGGFTNGTQQATTSGTSITFGSIPAGTKRITG